MLIIILILLIILYAINCKKINWWFNFNFPITSRLYNIMFFTLLFAYIAYILVSLPMTSEQLIQTALWSLILFLNIFIGTNIFVLLPILIFEYIKNSKNKSK